jgi:hypothetical protein
VQDLLPWVLPSQDRVTAERTLRVLGVRDDDADQPPALVVEDLDVDRDNRHRPPTRARPRASCTSWLDLLELCHPIQRRARKCGHVLWLRH